MAIVCSKCSTPDSVQIKRTMELPPDHWSDEISFCIVECSSCNFRWIVVFEESRRVALGTESWRSASYGISQEEMASLEAAMEQCPALEDKSCQCPGHRFVGQAFARGDSLRGGHWPKL